MESASDVPPFFVTERAISPASPLPGGPPRAPGTVLAEGRSNTFAACGAGLDEPTQASRCEGGEKELEGWDGGSGTWFGRRRLPVPGAPVYTISKTAEQAWVGDMFFFSTQNNVRNLQSNLSLSLFSSSSP